jgi:hypothetical protein
VLVVARSGNSHTGRKLKEYCIKRSGYRGFVDIGVMQIHVEKEEREVGADLQDRPLRHATAFDDGTVLPRHLVYQEIPRREKLFEWEGAPEKVKQVFAIVNDRGNSTPAFTMNAHFRQHATS